MPAPCVDAVRVPFYYTPSPSVNDDANTDDAAAPAAADVSSVFITHAFIEVVAFGDHFFWLHVSESPVAQQVPRLGACSVAVSLALSTTSAVGAVGGNCPRGISTSQLMEFEAARPQDMSASSNTTVQSVFSSSLSRKLVCAVARRFAKPVAVYVNCAVEGERCLSLLGTDGGSGFDMTSQFGALVYREAFALVAKHFDSESHGVVGGA
jgi:hypothetical protein